MKTLNVPANSFKPQVSQSEAHHGNEASDEAEVRKVVGVDGGSRVDLQTVVVLAGVFKQAVHGVEHLVGQQEEPLPAEREDTSHHAAEEHGIRPQRPRG